MSDLEKENEELRTVLRHLIRWANSGFCGDCETYREAPSSIYWEHHKDCGHLEDINKGRALLGLPLENTHEYEDPEAMMAFKAEERLQSCIKSGILKEPPQKVDLSPPWTVFAETVGGVSTPLEILPAGRPGSVANVLGWSPALVREIVEAANQFHYIITKTRVTNLNAAMGRGLDALTDLFASHPYLEDDDIEVGYQESMSRQAAVKVVGRLLEAAEKGKDET